MTNPVVRGERARVFGRELGFAGIQHQNPHGAGAGTIGYEPLQQLRPIIGRDDQSMGGERILRLRRGPLLLRLRRVHRDERRLDTRRTGSQAIPSPRDEAGARSVGRLDVRRHMEFDAWSGQPLGDRPRDLGNQRNVDRWNRRVRRSAGNTGRSKRLVPCRLGSSSTKKAISSASCPNSHMAATDVPNKPIGRGCAGSLPGAVADRLQPGDVSLHARQHVGGRDRNRRWSARASRQRHHRELLGDPVVGDDGGAISRSLQQTRQVGPAEMGDMVGDHEIERRGLAVGDLDEEAAAVVQLRAQVG